MRSNALCSIVASRSVDDDHFTDGFRYGYSLFTWSEDLAQGGQKANGAPSRTLVSSNKSSP